MSSKTTNLTAKQNAFCHEYMIDRNAAASARRAGYSEKTARQIGAENLSKPDIRARIAELEAEHLAAVDMKAEDVVRRYATIAMADPRNLIEYVVGACRYCYGKGHHHQWRNDDEFAEACDAWMSMPEKKREIIAQPDDAGGYGYTFKATPNEDCPMCDGFGIGRTVVKDTRNLSAATAPLYAGVKETKDGIEVKMLDQLNALEKLARHTGIFNKTNKHKDEPLREWLLSITNGTGSRFELNRGHREMLEMQRPPKPT